MNTIEINNLSKSYNNKKVIENFSISLEQDKLYILCGNSGVGKTTLLRIIAGLEEPDNGNVTGVSEKLAFDFQENRLLEKFDALTNIKLATKKSCTEMEIKNLLSEIGLAQDINKKIVNFSGGMKRRVSLIRALLVDSEVLLLDEPFDGLDKEIKKQAMELTYKYSKNKIVILVTHSEDEIEYYMQKKNVEKIIIK